MDYPAHPATGAGPTNQQPAGFTFFQQQQHQQIPSDPTLHSHGQQNHVGHHHNSQPQHQQQISSPGLTLDTAKANADGQGQAWGQPTFCSGESLLPPWSMPTAGTCGTAQTGQATGVVNSGGHQGGDDQQAQQQQRMLQPQQQAQPSATPPSIPYLHQPSTVVLPHQPQPQQQPIAVPLLLPGPNGQMQTSFALVSPQILLQAALSTLQGTGGGVDLAGLFGGGATAAVAHQGLGGVGGLMPLAGGTSGINAASSHAEPPAATAAHPHHQVFPQMPPQVQVGSTQQLHPLPVQVPQPPHGPVPLGSHVQQMSPLVMPVSDAGYVHSSFGNSLAGGDNTRADALNAGRDAGVDIGTEGPPPPTTTPSKSTPNGSVPSKPLRTTSHRSKRHSTSSATTTSPISTPATKPIPIRPTLSIDLPPTTTPLSTPSLPTPPTPTTTDGGGGGTHADPDEDDKRRRNTAASARFRAKKKVREQAMERTAREMTGRVENVGAKIKEMTREVLWLRGLVVDRDGVEALEQYYRDSGVAWHPERGLMHRDASDGEEVDAGGSGEREDRS